MERWTDRCMLFSCGLVRYGFCTKVHAWVYVFSKSWRSNSLSKTRSIVAVCSKYHGWMSGRGNHVISLSDWLARHCADGKRCSNAVLRWFTIEGALPWWSTAIRMRGKMGWITKCIRSGCHRMKVVSMCVQSLVCWKAVEGTVALISRENPRILSVQSLEAHHPP